MKKTNLRKFLLLFCMLACVFSFTACGNPQINTQAAKDANKQQIVEYLTNNFTVWARDMILYLNDNSDEAGTQKLISDAENAIPLDIVNGNIYGVNPQGINVKTIEFYNSWNSTKGELGKLAKDITANDITITTSDKTGTLCTISVKAQFEQREATFEFVINEEYELESGAINPAYTTGEKMEKAAMNTLIGMGTVFVVLIFISFIISLFKFVNTFTNREKKAEVKNVATEGVDNAIAQIVSSEESEEVDDLELIAVIAAAIAASEGTSPDGFRVRSIRKVNRR